MNILITGASGFIGSFLVEEALSRGFSVWAAVRKTSSRKYLPDSRINFVELDLDDTAGMERTLSGYDFDYVIHAAGATKCLNRQDFYRINTDGTVHLATAVRNTQKRLKRFVFISSLSVCGPLKEQEPHTEIADTDTPRPNTAYGESKLKAEERLRALDGFPCVILRPTGVYGPKERDYFMMAESIKSHVDFAVGYRRQDITFIYVRDLVQAAFLALTNGRDKAAYILSDGNTYSSRTFSDLLQREMGNPWVLHIKAPLWVLRLITLAGDAVGKIRGKITALNSDKYQIMKQRNWKCNISPAVSELGYKPEYDLERGVTETVKWYKDNGWL